jgi:hypothetical protein
VKPNPATAEDQCTIHAHEQPTKGPDELYSWPASGDEVSRETADNVAESPPAPVPPPETPRKAIEADALASPKKRKYDEVEIEPDDVFITPGKTSITYARTGLMSPADTPNSLRFKSVLRTGPQSSGSEDIELGTELLDRLQELKVELTPEAVAAVRDICNRHTWRMQGIARGRDITRLALKRKEERIADLQGKIAALEAERETKRMAIRHLKRELGAAEGRNS